MITSILRRLFVCFAVICLATGCGTLSDTTRSIPSDMRQTLNGQSMPSWQALGEAEHINRITELFPDYVTDRKVWASDLYRVYTSLDLAQTPSTYCATIAVVQQESSFKADPAVPGLSKLVRRELQARANRFLIPDFLLNGALNRKSSNGKTWNQRIDELRTEKDLNQLFEDMLNQLPLGQSWLEDFIPVKTAGPMQVSIAFAKKHAKENTYPFKLEGSLRNEVFTREGGLYFGAAILMDYPVQYTEPVYRFADFNAGQYASRNAAFQNALNKLTAANLVLDGDLLRYRGETPSLYPSNVEKQLRAISNQLQLNDKEIREDLLQEKTLGFSDTRTYNRVFDQAQAKTGQLLPRATIPQIRLQSPKITSKLTTSWFAKKVDRRFNDCLRRLRQ